MSPVALKFTGSRWAVYVTGPGVSRLLRDLGRTPHWDRRRRAYVITETTAADLLDQCEREERRVVVAGQSEQPIEQGRLW